LYSALAEGDSLPTEHQRFDFDLFMDMSTAFYTLTPIVDMDFVKPLIKRLEASKMTLDLKKICSGAGTQGRMLDVTKMEEFGFVSCNCSTYQHYLWCPHVTVDAMVKKLIKKFPPAFRPERLGSRRDGRIPKAARGGALGHQ